ncbi:uncharacterized protein LOC143182546 isoform X2 [Calliopsis andreniformis]|uniref:uncharacterized protein LOC143182546 isoform X2 n=1 Tax=Calliopsis andreniformis TaxID=337506 RepID=UPI003FCDA430
MLYKKPFPLVQCVAAQSSGLLEEVETVAKWDRNLRLPKHGEDRMRAMPRITCHPVHR